MDFLILTGILIVIAVVFPVIFKIIRQIIRQRKKPFSVLTSVHEEKKVNLEDF